MGGPSRPVIFYDGVCGLCDRGVQFVLRRDREGAFRFATLQSDYARGALAPHGVDPSALIMMYVLVDLGRSSERLLPGAQAALYVLRRLGGVRGIIWLLRFLPDGLLSLGYGLVARSRYSLFGRYDSCVLPRPEWQDRFIEASEG